jgi:hypothetical protein
MRGFRRKRESVGFTGRIFKILFVPDAWLWNPVVAHTPAMRIQHYFINYLKESPRLGSFKQVARPRHSANLAPQQYLKMPVQVNPLFFDKFASFNALETRVLVIAV